MAYMITSFKKITSIHERLAIEMNKCVQETEGPNGRPKERPP